MKTTLTPQENRNLIETNYSLTIEIKKVQENLITMNITDKIVLFVINKEIENMKRKVKANNTILSTYPTIFKNL